MLEIFDYGFFRNAFIGIILISISSAIIGTYVVTRRLVAISGGITHACFGGLGLGYYIGINPIITAMIVAVASGLGVEWLSQSRRVREDSAIAAIWGAGMAAGVIFVFLTPGYVPELNSFLFGNILTITQADLIWFGVFTAVIVAIFARWHRVIVAVAFDSDFARVSGLPVRLVSTVMMVLTATCIVLIIRMVGIMLLMSMLALPQMIAETRCRRFVTIMLASVGVSLAGCTAGLFLGTVIDVPCSALMVMVFVVLYGLAKITSRLTHRRRR